MYLFSTYSELSHSMEEKPLTELSVAINKYSVTCQVQDSPPEDFIKSFEILFN